MKVSELRREARESLKGRWGKGVSIVFAYLVVSFALGILAGFFEENSIMSVLFAILELIISVPLSFGLAFAFLKLKRNENVTAFEFVNMGISNFSKSWKIVGRTILKLILPIIVLIVGIIAYVVLVLYSLMQASLGGIDSLGITMIIGVLIYIVSIIYFTAVTLLYSLTSFVAYDNKEMTALEIVNESARLMKGNRWKMILLELSFIGWAILTVFTLGIGYLWLLPYMQVAMVCFYDRLAQVKSKDESTTDVVDTPIQEI